MFFDMTALDSLIDCDDVQPSEFAQEADDVLAACGYGDESDPDWYMEMPDSIRCEFESADRFTTD